MNRISIFAKTHFMEEIWKDIEGTDGMYRVSNLGNVIVRDYRAKGYWRGLNLVIQNTGYVVAHIYYDGERKARFVHRLVASAFIPNPHGLPLVNHKDQTPTNNRADNLEWCTPRYNVTYADAIEKRKARLIGVYKSNDAVAQYTEDGDFVAIHNSSRDASFAICGSRIKKCESIVQVCRGERNLCGGFQWRYAYDGYPPSLPAYRRTDMIEQLTLDGEHIAYHKTSYSAYKETGVQPAQILKCCKGEREQSGGYCWRYYSKG